MPRTSDAEREAILKGFAAPKQVASDGYVFENAKGGPYKYGR